MRSRYTRKCASVGAKFILACIFRGVMNFVAAFGAQRSEVHILSLRFKESRSFDRISEVLYESKVTQAAPIRQVSVIHIAPQIAQQQNQVQHTVARPPPKLVGIQGCRGTDRCEGSSLGDPSTPASILSVYGAEAELEKHRLPMVAQDVGELLVRANSNGDVLGYKVSPRQREDRLLAV